MNYIEKKNQAYNAIVEELGYIGAEIDENTTLMVGYDMETGQQVVAHAYFTDEGRYSGLQCIDNENYSDYNVMEMGLLDDDGIVDSDKVNDIVDEWVFE